MIINDEEYVWGCATKRLPVFLDPLSCYIHVDGGVALGIVPNPPSLNECGPAIKSMIESGEPFEFRSRRVCETDPDFKQFITYTVICRLAADGDFAKCEFLCYQRTKKGTETRLHDRYSIGFGGHINPGDSTFEAAVDRELREELGHKVKYPAPIVIGYVNEDETPVGRVHFGVVSLVLLPTYEHGEQFAQDVAAENTMRKLEWKTRETLLAEPALEIWTKLILENGIMAKNQLKTN